MVFTINLDDKHLICLARPHPAMCQNPILTAQIWWCIHHYSNMSNQLTYRLGTLAKGIVMKLWLLETPTTYLNWHTNLFGYPRYVYIYRYNLYVYIYIYSKYIYIYIHLYIFFFCIQSSKNTPIISHNTSWLIYFSPVWPSMAYKNPQEPGRKIPAFLINNPKGYL